MGDKGRERKREKEGISRYQRYGVELSDKKAQTQKVQTVLNSFRKKRRLNVLP
jgi:hypothetical protein